MIVLGIDPGLANAGYGVVARRRGRLVALDGGVIDTPAAVALESRLATVHKRVLELIDEHACEAMALEQLYFGANVQTAFAVGHARGVTMLAGGQRGLPCFSYTPQRVKSAVCGNGRAAKDQVARMVQTLLELPELPRPDHASDALAVAICHHNAAPLVAALATAAQTPARVAAGAGRGAGAHNSVEQPAARVRARMPARTRGRVGAPR
jgi:crossover junction endodeoxyribonuclease RuvC